MTRAALALLAGAAATASGDGTAQWLHHVTTDDGDALVEPGEIATITLIALMEPNAGEAEDASFGFATFDVLGDEGAGKGQILGWTIHQHFACLTGDLTTSDGVSLYGTFVGQFPLFGPFTYDNPVEVLTFQWQPGEYVPFDAVYQTQTSDNGISNSISVWEDANDTGEELVTYPIAEADVSVTVACPDDFNGDGAKNILDFVAFQQAWLAQSHAADCNGDGAIDVLDFICFQQRFLKGCP